MGQDEYQKLFPKVRKLTGKKVTLLLGTDAHIEEGSIEQQERRVGITPNQLAALKAWLQRAGVFLDCYFVQGTGARSGFFDGDYLNVGGHLVFEHQLATLPPPDVVHALKEPCPYEVFIPGPFIRIGALHSGAFDERSGLASLLKRKNFCAIFDGSAVGGYSYKHTNGYPIPIRSSMSVFAGEIAVDEVAKNLVKNSGNGKVVISGGGVVGNSAVNQLLDKWKKNCKEILIVEIDSEKCSWFRQQYKDNYLIRIVQKDKLNNEDLKGAQGLILTAFRPGHQAPKVVKLRDLRSLSDNAIIVDVSIDEKGGISVPNLDFEKVSLAQVVKRVKDEIDRLGKNLRYIADSHLPRKYPEQASEAHGKAVLPYLAVLLYLCASEGGPPQAINYILKQICIHNKLSYFDALVCDLKDGLAYRRPDPIYVSSRMTGVLSNMADFLKREGIEWKVR